MKAARLFPSLWLCLMLAACNGGGGGDGNGGGNEPPPVDPPPASPPPNSGQVVGTLTRLLPAPEPVAGLSTDPDLAVVVRDQTSWNALLNQYPTVLDALPANLQSPNFNEVNLVLLGMPVAYSPSSDEYYPPSIDSPVVSSNNSLWVGVEKCGTGVVLGGMAYKFHFSVYTGPVLPANVEFHWLNRPGVPACTAYSIHSVNIVQ